MLIAHQTLQAIAAGAQDLVFRRWAAPRVAAGQTLKTVVGVLEVVEVVRVAISKVSTDDARRAGFPTRAALCADLARQRQGSVFRIALRWTGEDPRIALREDTTLSPTEWSALLQKVQALGARSETGPFGLQYLKLIADGPGTRAPDLASGLGLRTAFFKARVRQLKEFGLTESLKVGYRLSPRGQALLRHAENR